MPDNVNHLEVFYDSACPLCRREIAFYRRLDREDRIDWLDLHAVDVDPSVYGISHEQALGRLHAVERRGRVYSGARAFAAISRRIPGLRTAGVVVGRPPLVWLAEVSYRLFLRVRPGISRTIGRLERTRHSSDR